ncbi:MAG TPA: glycosyltransferase family 4 protein [Acidimicrobiales bacterium]|nr:glycosyltransferase family 4 protein [Acidimicrobiales bacterium]
MKIAMVSPYALSRPGGVQGQVIGLARALRGLGHQVTVLGPDDAGGEVGASPDTYVLGRPTGLHSNGSVAPVTISPLAARRAVRFVRRGDFDVVHLHEPLAPCAGYGFMLRSGVPLVGTYHRAGVSRWVPLLKPLAALVGRRLQVRAAVSEAARETGARSGGGAFDVLFNGVDLARFASAIPVRDPEGRPTVLFLGRHEERKGLSVLLDAFAEVDRPAVLWVAGDGPGREVQQRRHPESERVHWLGLLRDDEVAARLVGADVLCAPSLRGESFGMVVLEGLAARCVVVASDLQGYRAAAGGHALLVPPGDVAQLSRALGVALADVVERSGLASVESVKAAEAYAEEWSMETLADRYVPLYERAIAMAAC